MLTTRYRGRVKGKSIVLDENVSLPDNTEVDVTVTPVMSVEEQRAIILTFAEMEPRVSREDVDALMQAIEEGRRPPSKVDIFQENSAEEGHG